MEFLGYGFSKSLKLSLVPAIQSVKSVRSTAYEKNHVDFIFIGLEPKRMVFGLQSFALLVLPKICYFGNLFCLLGTIRGVFFEYFLIFRIFFI